MMVSRSGRSFLMASTLGAWLAETTTTLHPEWASLNLSSAGSLIFTEMGTLMAPV